MKIYKIGIYLFFILFNFSVFADDINPKIDTVNYDGNLSDDTIIKINGADLDGCTNLKINDKKINIITKTASVISFKYIDILNNNGSIKLECGANELKNYYSFPVITNITGLKDNSKDRNITVSGENFGFEPLVNLEGGSFEYGIKQNTIITGIIPNTLENNFFYITVNGLKSNIFKLNIKIPKITFAYSIDNFSKMGSVEIFGSNLNYYNNSIIHLGDKEITDYKFNKDNGSIIIKTNSKLGKQNLYIESNGYISNSISLNIIGELPYIDKIYKKYINIEIDGEYEDVNVIAISGKNFPGYLEDIIVTNNGIKKSIIGKNGDELYLDESILDGGNNFFQVDVNGKVSNVINLYEELNLPLIQGFDFLPNNETKRVMKIYLYNFNIETDKILLDTGIVTPVECSDTYCIIEFPDNILKAKIYLSRNNILNQNYKSFDIGFKNRPYIDYIYIKGIPKQGTKIEIVGSNLSDSNISIINLFAKDSKGNYDMKLTSNKITGTLPFGYDINSESKISITKYGLSSEIKFIGNNIDNTKIYGPPILSEISSNDDNGLYKNGNIVTIKGKGFTTGDQVVIGNVRTPVNYIDNNNASFIIPNTISDGEYNIFIENKNFLKSNGLQLIVVGEYYDPNIIFSSEKIIKKNYEVGKNNTGEIYSLLVENKLQDLLLKNINFKISDFNSSSNLGTFELLKDGKIIGVSLVDSSGLINFNNTFLIPRDNDYTKITLRKKSIYGIQGDYKINFSPIGLDIITENTREKFININYDDLYPNRIKVVNNSLLNCIDVRLDSMNCNKYISSGVLIKDKIDKNKNTFVVSKKTETEKNADIIKKVETLPTIKLKGITQYEFKSKSYKNLNKMLDKYILKLSKKSKYKGKILEIEDKVNDIIKDLFLYEKYKDNKMKRTVMKKKLYKDAKLFKDLLK